MLVQNTEFLKIIVKNSVGNTRKENKLVPFQKHTLI